MPHSRLFIPIAVFISLVWVSQALAQTPVGSIPAGQDTLAALSDSLLVKINELEMRLRELEEELGQKQQRDLLQVLRQQAQQRAQERTASPVDTQAVKSFDTQQQLPAVNQGIGLGANFLKRYTPPKSTRPSVNPSTARGFQHIPPGQSTATGISRAFNPAMSVNGLFLGGVFQSGNQSWREYAECGMDEGLTMQEAELQFTSFVSPFFKADMIASFSADEFLIEEVFITSAALPFGWKARIGKIYVPLGKHNTLHLHHFPFIEAPLIHTMLLTDAGMADFGAELSYLFPTPFYLEATGGVFNGDHPFFDTASGRNMMGLGRVNALWDLSEDTTLELGGSYITGRSSLSDPPRNESVVGADATIKWRPLRRALYTQAEWQLEYLRGSQYLRSSLSGYLPGGGEVGGLVTHLRYRFNRTWWIQGRFDKTGIPGGEEVSLTRYTLQLALAPDEFELWRVQYSLTDPGAGSPTFGLLSFQINFTIGSHPAHVY